MPSKHPNLQCVFNSLFFHAGDKGEKGDKGPNGYGLTGYTGDQGEKGKLQHSQQSAFTFFSHLKVEAKGLHTHMQFRY